MNHDAYDAALADLVAQSTDNFDLSPLLNILVPPGAPEA